MAAHAQGMVMIRPGRGEAVESPGVGAMRPDATGCGDIDGAARCAAIGGVDVMVATGEHRGMQWAQRAMRRIVTRGNVGKGALVALLVALALAIRVALYPVQTSDYTAFVSPWYDYIAGHGGFAALKDTFS